MIILKSTNIHDKFTEYAKHVLKDGFVYDAENEKQIKECIDVLINNEVGLKIVGNSGSGKSLFFEMMQQIIHPQSPRMFANINVLTVVSEFDRVGSRVYDKWKTKNVCFQDLGTEDIGVFMGKKTEVMEKFIQERYNLFKTTKLKTHFTTNMHEQDILNRYGTRCASRFKEMCDNIGLGAKKTYTDRRIYRNFIGLPQVYHAIKKSEDDIIFEEKLKAAKETAKNQPPDQHERKGLGARARERFNGGA